MRKTLVIGSLATVFGLAVVGGTLAWSHHAQARGGWADFAAPMGGHGPGMGMGMGMGMGPGGGRGMGAMQLFEQFDRSGEGRVSQADVDAVRAERFASFDVDGDGVLALAEFEQLWLEAMREAMVRGFQQLDRDGDAAVTEAEFLTPFGNVVARLDQDGDGVVTRDELSQMMRDRRAEMGGRRGPGAGRRGPLPPTD